MKRRKILYFREDEVATILERRLVKEGYRIWPKIGIEDVIAPESGGCLTAREKMYLRNATFDFVVAHNNEAILVVEFDGTQHFTDRETIERDTIKNRLCMLANLPLLRITSTEIHEHEDKVTALDYALVRYVAAGREYPAIMQEIKEYRGAISPDSSPGDLAVLFDPAFHFSLRCRFLGTAEVRERLWLNYRIHWESGAADQRPSAKYFCNVSLVAAGSLRREDFYTSRKRATVRRLHELASKPIFSEEVEASFRSWLPVTTGVPVPDGFVRRWDKFYSGEIWFPHPPGISFFDITETFVDYLALRAVERWAKRTIGTGPSARPV